MAFIEVKGKRHVDPSTQSKLLVEPAAYFLKYCYGPLLELFKNKMSDNVLVARAYSAGRDWRLKLFQFDIVAANSKIGEAYQAIAEENESLPDSEKKVKSHLWSLKNYPRVLTVDSAGGDEALVVFVDPGYGGGKNAEQGFIKDRSAVLSSVRATRPLSLSLAILATTKKSRLVQRKPTCR